MAVEHQVAPVEYIVIEFPGNKFRGEIAPAIADLVERDVIHILDLVFVKKDSDGGLTLFEYDDFAEAASFAVVDGDAGGLIGEDDIALLSEGLAPDSSALFILWEDLWASDLGRAVSRAGGQFVTGGRVPHDLIVECIDAVELEASGGAGT